MTYLVKKFLFFKKQNTTNTTKGFFAPLHFYFLPTLPKQIRFPEIGVFSSYPPLKKIVSCLYTSKATVYIVLYILKIQFHDLIPCIFSCILLSSLSVTSHYFTIFSFNIVRCIPVDTIHLKCCIVFHFPIFPDTYFQYFTFSLLPTSAYSQLVIIIISSRSSCGSTSQWLFKFTNIINFFACCSSHPTPWFWVSFLLTIEHFESSKLSVFESIILSLLSP